jgi:hypothetical protein
MKRKAMALAVALLCAGMAAAQDDDKIYSKSFKGEVPQEIESAKESWINSDDAISLESLRGKPVWLEFSFLD